jgi:outer membrane protein assembly factor BamB
MSMTALSTTVLAAAAIAAAGVLFAAGVFAGQEVDLETRAKIEGYVRLLGADDAKTRDDASGALVALGDVARPFLEKALVDPSAEVRDRVRGILARLEDARRAQTGEDQTWPGLRGGPTRSGVASGELPRTKPSLAWKTEVHEKTLLQGAVVPAGAYVACLSSEGVVRAFASKDGARLWLSEIAADVTASGVLAGDRLVVPTGKGLVALDTKDGHVAWRFDAPYGSNAAPAIVGRRVFAAFRNLGVKAFDLSTGEVVFSKPISPAGALLADADLVVCGTADGALVRLDVDTGKERWRKTLGAPPNMGPTLAAPGVIVAFTKDRWLRAFRAEDGKEIWGVREATVSGSESLAAAAGRVFLTDESGWIIARDAASGRLIWKRNEGLVEMGGPCATSGEVITSSRGRMTCRDADCGDYLWRLDVDSPDNAAPAAAAGRIYVLYDDELRCYERK